MLNRVLIALLLALSPRMQAEPPAARRPWHAAVTAPRPGLPVVTIDFGYPGPYLPAVNSPIVLNATASDVPFDGYIGFHFEFQGRRTLDVPVIARARLRPHQPWSFPTFAGLRRFGNIAVNDSMAARREIAIEWRNRSMETIASQSAGVPAWRMFYDELLPLRVLPGGAPLEPAAALGGDAYGEHADALSDRAQWYAGFSSVVIPLETWLNLPRRVREAIFGSGIYIVLIGLPQPDHAFDEIDRAILPVTFTASPGSYDAPWPYRRSGKPVATPMSWTAKPGVGKIGPPKCPYIARTQTSAWIADEAALDWPLPSIDQFASRGYIEGYPVGDSSNLFATHRTAILAFATLLICVAGWLLMRRRPLAALAIGSLLIAGIVVAQRSRIRPPAGMLQHVVRIPIAPGIVQRFEARLSYGSTPVAVPALAPEEARTSLTGDDGIGDQAEIRTASTSPSMGVMVRDFPWDSVRRWTSRREVDASLMNPDHIGIVMLGDFHGSIFYRSMRPPNGGPSRISGDFHRRSDRQIVCLFGLPPIHDNETAVFDVSASTSGLPVELTWDGGHTTLTLTKKDIYASPSAAIPPAVLREIAAHGGVVEATLPPQKGQWFIRMGIEIQEKKS